MTWLVWRQGRAEHALVAGLLAILALLLVLTGLHMHSVFSAMRLSSCTGDGQSLSIGCSLRGTSFLQRFDGLNQMGPWLGLVPGLIGVLLATPLVLELDQGTYRLAWTQSVTPGRWLTTRVALLMLGVLLVGLVMTALATYWRAPLDALGGHVGPNEFDLEGVLPVAYALFGASAVLAIGAVTRRTGLAVAGGFGIYLAARLVLRAVREHLIPPLHALTRPPAGPAGIRHAWVISQNYVGPHGSAGAYAALNHCSTADGDLDTACLVHHHIMSSWIYEPASRFWSLQAIEGGVFLGLSAVCLGLAIWWIRNRIA